jgi:hypothetical protein
LCRPRPARTSCSSIAAESATPSMWTLRSVRRPTLASLMPVAAGPTPVAWALSPNCVQSPAGIRAAVGTATVELAVAEAGGWGADRLVALDVRDAWWPHAATASTQTAGRRRLRARRVTPP